MNINIKETAVNNKSSKIIHVSHSTDIVGKLHLQFIQTHYKILCVLTSEEVDLLEAWLSVVKKERREAIQTFQILFHIPSGT